MKPVAWEAEDGTVFWRENECKEYEEKCRKKQNLKSRFYRKDGLRLFPEVEDYENMCRECWYAYIANEKEADIANALMSTEDFTIPGVYLYDDAYGGFRHTNELYAQIHKAFVTVEE